MSAIRLLHPRIPNIFSIPRASTSAFAFSAASSSRLLLARFSSAASRSSAALLFKISSRSFASPRATRISKSSSFASPTPSAEAKNETMATTTEAPKCEWLVILPDKPGVLEKRVSVRESHLAGLGNAYPPDFWLVGGALLGRAPHDPRNVAGKPLLMQGSATLVWAESEDEVKRLLSGDVYAREGVWDMENLQCWAFKSAVRKGL